MYHFAFSCIVDVPDFGTKYLMSIMTTTNTSAVLCNVSSHLLWHSFVVYQIHNILLPTNGPS